jgi:hypothetical protein
LEKRSHQPSYVVASHQSGYIKVKINEKRSCILSSLYIRAPLF